MLDPDLASLGNFGGRTLSHLPEENSLALNMGDDSKTETRFTQRDLVFDQRGAGFDRFVQPAADIGAIERSPTDMELSHAIIDGLCDALGSNDPQFDFDENGVVGSPDLDVLITEIFGTHFGDVDLNGEVAFDDFLVVSVNFGQQVDGWAQGDFDCDGVVSFADFLQLSVNFGASR